MLVDTGADINLIKLNVLKDEVLVSDSKIHKMSGITNQLVSTLGCTTLLVSNGEQEIETEFHVVPSDLPIVGDGILGDPFLRGNKIFIDVFGCLLTSAVADTSTIPARSEVIIPVKIINKYPSDQQNVLIYAQNINENLLCGNVLNTSKNQQILINVINPTEQSQTINIPKLSDLSHEVFDTVSMDNVQTSQIVENPNNRIQLIKNSIRCEHMNQEEKESILQLCSEFSDVFFLEGDTVRCAKAVQHEIKTPGVSQRYINGRTVCHTLKRRKLTSK